MEYRRRYLDDELDELASPPFAVAIDGPKGVGKTATAIRRADRVLNLDEQSVRALVEADVKRALSGAGTTLVDEWQRLPQVWDGVRRQVDDDPAAAFLLTGSATPLPGTDTHSGAGRILSLRLRPMSLPERGATDPSVRIADLFRRPGGPIEGHTRWSIADYAEQICASGFPAIHATSRRRQRAELDGYVTRIIDRDLVEQGVSLRRPDTLRRWLSAYAAASSTTASYTSILDAASAGETVKPAKTTNLMHRDLLTQIWILDPVPPWLPQGSELTRLKVSAKHELADPALAARLLNQTPETLLQAPARVGRTVRPPAGVAGDPDGQSRRAGKRGNRGAPAHSGRRARGRPHRTAV